MKGDTMYYRQPLGLFKSAEVSVGTSEITIPINGHDEVAVPNGHTHVAITLKNTGDTNALNSFTLQVMYHPQDGTFVDLLKDADFNAVNDVLLLVSDEGPQELAAGNTATFVARINGAVALRLKTKAAAATTITISGRTFRGA